MTIDMVREAIFQGEDGRQIKFFIQKDLDVEIVETLHNHISENGGRVETRVPIQGFILIDPRSPEGGRLTDCWETSGRPLRNFVPYTFVAACLEARRLIPQVFRKHGVALKFHIHPCITDEDAIETLRNNIWHSGGHPLATESEADIIIADESLPSFRALVDRFDHHHTKYVEGISWVTRCVESGMYENTPVTKKNFGGRIPGNKRTEFTPEDDNYLAMYIACRLPDSNMRGRTGNKLYLDLCSRLDLYPWAERHPWQSWRERYKNNSERFAKLITSYLDQHPTPENGKGLHGYVRVFPKSPSKQSNEVQFETSSKEENGGSFIGNVDKANEEWGSQWSIKEGRKSPPAWGKGKRQADRDCIEVTTKRQKTHRSDHNDEDEQGNQSVRKLLQGRSNQNHHATKSVSGSVDGITTQSNVGELSEAHQARSRSPMHEDETTNPFNDNSQHDDVGVETQTLLDANRAMLTGSTSSPVTLSLPEGNRLRETNTTDFPVKPAPVVAKHLDADVKLALVGVACRCRFLLDEVMEEYEELNQNLDATRAYFNEIRALINEKKSTREKQK